MIKLTTILAGTLAAAWPAVETPAQSIRPVQTAHPGDALRSRLGVELPHAETLVIVYGVAQHHTRTEWSVVAWRERNGRWKVQRAGEESGGLFKIDRHALAGSTKVLGATESAELDGLVNDPEVYREALQGGDPPVGGFASQMEIITPKRRRAADWEGRLAGRLGEIADLVIGAGLPERFSSDIHPTQKSVPGS